MENKSKYRAPTYFEKYATYENEECSKQLDEIEWRAQIQSSLGNKKFRIKYYGNLNEELNLICHTDFSRALVLGEDIETKEEIVLFDGCKFGYNGMFAEHYSKAQIENRPTEKFLVDKDGNDIFEILVSVCYNIPYDEEMDNFINEHHMVELISGDLITAEELERNGFDWIYVYAINEEGNFWAIVDEELA